MGGVDEALDDDVIDDGAGGCCCNGNDELLIAVAVAVFVLDDIVEDDEELLPLSDAGPVWRSIMRSHSEICSETFTNQTPPRSRSSCFYYLHSPHHLIPLVSFFFIYEGNMKREEREK